MDTLAKIFCSYKITHTLPPNIRVPDLTWSQVNFYWSSIHTMRSAVTRSTLLTAVPLLEAVSCFLLTNNSTSINFVPFRTFEEGWKEGGREVRKRVINSVHCEAGLTCFVCASSLVCEQRGMSPENRNTISQPINQTTDWSINQSINQSVNQSINHAINQSRNQSINTQSINQSTRNQSINHAINQWRNQPINDATNQLINHAINQSINQSITQSINQSITQSINQSITQSASTVNYLINSNLSPIVNFYFILFY